MSTIEPLIIITRMDNKIVTISAAIPVYIESGHEGFIEVHLPLLASMTWALNKNDIRNAVESTLISLCLGAERLGNGIERELESIGWIINERKAGKSALRFYNAGNNFKLNQILKSSDDFVIEELPIPTSSLNQGRRWKP